MYEPSVNQLPARRRIRTLDSDRDSERTQEGIPGISAASSKVSGCMEGPVTTLSNPVLSPTIPFQPAEQSGNVP
eukprot:349769-Chlamydomonas_euryale.AAC.3